MNPKQLNNLYQRAIDALIKEISAFNNDEDLWKTVNGISNSAGNLSLHLIGNVNHFLGAVVFGNEYKRDRDAEFSTKGLTRENLVAQLTAASAMLNEKFVVLPESSLATEYPFDFAGKEDTGYYLQFFLNHFHYHTGQVNYLRRMITHS